MFAIEMWPIDRPKPYPANPRRNDAAVEGVARSIQQFGFRNAIVVDRHDVLICGHTRLLAARKIGLSEVPVHVAAELSDEQVRALRIADNRLHELSFWDMDLLPIELVELKDLGIDMTLLGWSPEDLSEVMAPQGNAGLTDADEVPSPPDEATTKPGDLWILGDHRLLCGDSSKPEDLDRLLGGVQVHLCNTDPPYNVKVEPRSNNAIAAGLSSFQASPAAGRVGASLPSQGDGAKPHQGVTGRATHARLRAKDRPLANDFVTDEAFDIMLDAWFGNIARVLIPGGGFYIWGGYANCGNYPPVLKRHGLYFSQAVIWDKQHPVLTRKDFMGAHEWCFYGWKEGAAHRYFGPNNIPDLWAIKKLHSSKMVHLTEKPVELAARAMAYSSRPGENILDLFGGSGSTLIAAEQQGRRAFLMELDTLYCDVIVQRYESFTGKKAVLERTGETYAATQGARMTAPESPGTSGGE